MTATTTTAPGTAAAPETARRPGRPSEGTRVSVRIPEALLDQLDELAARSSTSRAVVFREILRIGLGRASDESPDGVDRAQIQHPLDRPDDADWSAVEANLALTPAERSDRLGAAVRFVEAGRRAMEAARG